MDLTNVLPVSNELVRLYEGDHRYVVGEGLTERSVPSFSALMERSGLTTDYRNVDPELLEFRARVGTAVHRAAHHSFLGWGDPLDDPDRFVRLHAEPHVEAFLKWQSAHEIEPIFMETPAFNPIDGYASTEDFIGIVDGDPWVIDYKTTSRIAGSVAVQTMGQRRCFTFPGGGEPRRGALHLTKKGTFKMHEYREHSRDGVVVQAIALAYRAKEWYA
jgi:hypothetical protein